MRRLWRGEFWIVQLSSWRHSYDLNQANLVINWGHMDTFEEEFWLSMESCNKWPQGLFGVWGCVCVWGGGGGGGEALNIFFVQSVEDWLIAMQHSLCFISNNIIHLSFLALWLSCQLEYFFMLFHFSWRFKAFALDFFEKDHSGLYTLHCTVQGCANICLLTATWSRSCTQPHDASLIIIFSFSGSLLGVHCTHGLNRAGYIVCR